MNHLSLSIHNGRSFLWLPRDQQKWRDEYIARTRTINGAFAMVLKARKRKWMAESTWIIRELWPIRYRFSGLSLFISYHIVLSDKALQRVTTMTLIDVLFIWADTMMNQGKYRFVQLAHPRSRGRMLHNACRRDTLINLAHCVMFIS